jgi:hypothetical protein
VKYKHNGSVTAPYKRCIKQRRRCTSRSTAAAAAGVQYRSAAAVARGELALRTIKNK